MIKLEGLRCEPMRDRARLRRQRIIDAARILFNENGFHATGVAQIARASGVAVGQIYRDFEAKEDIVAEIVEGDLAEFMACDSLHRAISTGDAAQVREWIRHFLGPTHRDAKPLFAEIVAESSRNERIAAIFSRVRQEVNASMLAALTLLAPGDHVASRRALLADLVLTQSLGLMQFRLSHPGVDTDGLTDLIMSVIAREVDALRGAAQTA